MSGKHLNDISKVYLDTIANVKKAETDADIKRWEDLGGPTPGNYRADDNSAKLTEEYKLISGAKKPSSLARDSSNLAIAFLIFSD